MWDGNKVFSAWVDKKSIFTRYLAPMSRDEALAEVEQLKKEFDDPECLIEDGPQADNDWELSVYVPDQRRWYDSRLMDHKTFKDYTTGRRVGSLLLPEVERSKATFSETKQVAHAPSAQRRGRRKREERNKERREASEQVAEASAGSRSSARRAEAVPAAKAGRKKVVRGPSVKGKKIRGPSVKGKKKKYPTIEAGRLAVERAKLAVEQAKLAVERAESEAASEAEPREEEKVPPKPKRTTPPPRKQPTRRAKTPKK